MLVATLKGTFIMAMAAGQLAVVEQVESENVVPVQQQQQPLHYLLEVELYDSDDIIVRWL